MFVDEATIYVESGKGGNGCASFHRAKYMPNMGPDGGDGGRGGDVIFIADSGMNTLYDFRHKQSYKAQKGEDGRSCNCSGKSGEDLIIKVPVGTVVREANTHQVIVDMAFAGQKEIIAKGGKGGKGNQHYATATMQIPQYAQLGQEGQSFELELELKVLADVGLLGYPNAGKSTFLSRVSNAKPKIASYPFTTITPNLGVVHLDYGSTLVIADIPGLIDGAAEGVGLGHEFLKHLERNRLLIHIVDASATDGRDPVDDIKKINHELSLYSEELAKLPQIIAANKIDLPEAELFKEELEEYCAANNYPLYFISAYTGEGVQELLNAVVRLRDSLPQETIVFEREYYPDAANNDDFDGIFVEKTADHEFTISGEPIVKMLGFTHLESEKGFDFFQKFMRERGILKRLESLDIEEGDTVIVGDIAFDYYP